MRIDISCDFIAGVASKFVKCTIIAKAVKWASGPDLVFTQSRLARSSLKLSIIQYRGTKKDLVVITFQSTSFKMASTGEKQANCISKFGKRFSSDSNSLGTAPIQFGLTWLLQQQMLQNTVTGGCSEHPPVKSRLTHGFWQIWPKVSDKFDPGCWTNLTQGVWQIWPAHWVSDKSTLLPLREPFIPCKAEFGDETLLPCKSADSLGRPTQQNF